MSDQLVILDIPRDYARPDSIPRVIASEGSGPWPSDDLEGELEQVGLTVKDPFQNGYECLIVGQNAFDRERLLRLLRKRTCPNLRVYSQEMFIAFLKSGSDPYDGNASTLYELAASHAMFELLAEVWPHWSSGILDSDNLSRPKQDHPKIGPLKKIGYQVGANGKPVDVRRKILVTALSVDFRQWDWPEGYIENWGEPDSPERLEAIAGFLANQCSNKQSSPTRRLNGDAVREWHADLTWLRDTHYDPEKHRFCWPFSSSNVGS